MFNFLLGVLAATIVFAIFPGLAERPGEWIRSFWDWLNNRLDQDS